MTKLALALALLVTACKDKPAPVGNAGSGSGSGGEGEAAEFVKSARDILVGHPAPAVALEMLDGSHVELAQLIGKKPIYLKFWATWCVPCREQMPHLEATFHAHGDKLAVYAVDVGVDDPIENVRDWVGQKKLTLPVAYDRDGSVAEKFYLNVTPQHVLIDTAGIVRYVGWAVTPELEQAITAVVEGHAAPVAAAAVREPAKAVPVLALDNGSKLELASRPHTPMVLTFATLFCDTYIADSRAAIGKTCAAHAHQIARMRQAYPDLTWVVVAWPVWTADEDIADFHKRLGVDVPVGIDRGNLWSRHFGVHDTYTTLLLDGAGTELGRAGGDGSTLETLLAKAH